MVIVSFIMRFLFLLPFLCVSQMRSHRCNKEKEAKLVRIFDSQAKCLDGSPPAYYIKRGHGEGRNKYIVFFEGGGWCYNLDNCYQRSFKDLGSSRRYPSCLPFSDMKYYISPDPTNNPMMWNWNIVRVKYCDATSYSGDAIINYKVWILRLYYLYR